MALTLSSLAALATLALPLLPDGWPLHLGLLTVAFGAMGSFPTYFAFSQDLSLQHQGKVSGFLGASAHVALAMVYPLEGWAIAWSGSYEPVLMLIGLAPAMACLLVWLYWPATLRTE